MSFDELIHTCSHEDVATAAVFSLGLSFAGKVAFAARAHDISMGAFASQAVNHFAISARESERKALLAAMQDEDQPLLAGLRFILGPILEDESRANGYAAAIHALGLPAANAHKINTQCEIA